MASKPRTSPLPNPRQTPDRRPASRSARKIAAERAAQRRRTVVYGAVGVALLAALVLVLFNLPSSDPSPSGEDLPAVVAVADPHPGVASDGRSLGDPNAPVTVIEYGGYQCPGCGVFAREGEAQLIEEYVAAGLVRFEFRDYVVVDRRPQDTESQFSAEAAFCAAEQGRFWPFHATLYGNQHGENEGAFSRGRLWAMAEVVGLDMERFETCLDGRAYRDAVEASNAEATALGLTGTPSFVVNGRVIDYAGYDSLKAAIEEALVVAGVSR